MAKTSVRISGLKELDRALGKLPEATAKRVLRDVLKEAGEPLARTARRLAPKDEYHLYDSIDVSTRLNKRQAALHKKEANPAFQEMFVGTNNPAGVQQEFGNERHGAQPFMRPAWDAEKKNVLDLIANLLWGKIEQAAEKLASKAPKG